jgi:hypothetical protein
MNDMTEKRWRLRQKIQGLHKDLAANRPKVMKRGYVAFDIYTTDDGEWNATILSNRIARLENKYVRESLSIGQVQELQLWRIPRDVVRNFAKTELNMIDGPDPLE